MKLSELGLVHRHELSGVLHGLFRTKAFTIDDTHIFCYGDQIKSEITKVVQLILKVYRSFGFKEISIFLSTKPKESMGSDEIWQTATEGLRAALSANDIDFEINEGGGAFYGPKIDFEIRDSIGRDWQCGTIQLDFMMPERFDLEYVAADGKKKRPVMVHRAVFGSVERFYGILVEHFGGAFPTWLAPIQVRIATITDQQNEAADQLNDALHALGILSEVDKRVEKIGYKIRASELQKIPYTVVIGAKEVEANTLSVRARGRQDLGSMSQEAFMSRICDEIKAKTLTLKNTGGG